MKSGGRENLSQDLHTIVKVPGTFKPFGMDTHFSGLLLAQQVQDDMSDNGHVGRTIAFAILMTVFSKSNIQHPVELVFNAPMMADVAQKLLGIGL